MKNSLLTIIVSIVLIMPHTLLAQEKIKVGMSGRYYPFTFVQKDVLQGFEVDFIKEIAHRADLEVEFITSSFSGLFGMMEAGHIDTIANQITITDEREVKYNFSTPYVIDGAQVVVKVGRNDIAGIEDLKGKKVAVNLGSNFEQILRSHDTAGKINIITYDSGLEQDVVLGRSDAFVMDRVGSAQLIKKSGLPLQLAGEPFEKIENALPFAKNEKQEVLRLRINKAIQEMTEDGTLKEISVKWFDTDITQ